MIIGYYSLSSLVWFCGLFLSSHLYTHHNLAYHKATLHPLPPTLSLSLSFSHARAHTHIVFSQISLLAPRPWLRFSNLAGRFFSFHFLQLSPLFMLPLAFPIPPNDSPFDLILASSLFLDVVEESVYIIGFV